MGRQATAQRTRRGGWRQWTAAEAQKVLTEWKATGLPLATFAREQGLNDTRLRWWRTRLGDWGSDVSLVSFRQACLSPPVFVCTAVLHRGGLDEDHPAAA